MQDFQRLSDPIAPEILLLPASGMPQIVETPTSHSVRHELVIGDEYLPPYSPDFNPIENAFAKLKALLRAKAERTIAALWDAVGAILERFTPDECANYFKAAGYDPD